MMPVYLDGLAWPYAVADDQRRAAFAQLGTLEVAISLARQHRLAVQAGGNIGLWPRRLAETFARVMTFEPYEPVRECLRANVPPSVEVRPEALGAAPGRCGLQPHKLGQHYIIEGSDYSMIALDDLGLSDLDLLQLDIEGYEGQALIGAEATIERSWPIIHLELKRHALRYKQQDREIEGWLLERGYRRERSFSHDVVFARP